MTDDRRQQIVRAARAMLLENPNAKLAVRAVADRAGIGPSTLRYYFPAQQELYEAVYATMFQPVGADLRIHDATVPARERLGECLRQLLPPARQADTPVDHWIDTLTSVFGSTGNPGARTAWAAYAVQTRRQITGWLQVLSKEGAVAGGAEERSARFLLTMLDGLAVARITAAPGLDPAQEEDVLNDALSVVIRSR